MDDREPHTRHSDDARADEAPPTDAVTDEVRESAAAAEGGDILADDERDDFPDRPAQTHP